MRSWLNIAVLIALCGTTPSLAEPKTDTSPHKIQFITVHKDVRLEVLDWGGEGPPLIFLAGLTDTAHAFDGFAPKFTDKHHVYGITRRGFGASSAPLPTAENYDADRLGDDVLAVIAALKLDKPVLVGHSIAGEELSSIGTRQPEKVAGLVYLDAAYSYAFYNADGYTTPVDMANIRRAMDFLQSPTGTRSERRAAVEELKFALPRFQRDLNRFAERLEIPEQVEWSPIDRAIANNPRKYTDIKVPVLAIFASPQKCAPNCDTPEAKTRAATTLSQVNNFEAHTPSAKVVRIPYADHNIVRSHEADVTREMNAFMDGLEKSQKEKAN